MPRRHANIEDANEDEEDLIEWEQQTTRDTVLWLIDAGTKMHDTLIPASNEGQDDDAPEVSLFHRAMQAAFSFQKSKLVNSPNDLVGIILFNTVSHLWPCLLLLRALSGGSPLDRTRPESRKQARMCRIQTVSQ